MPMGGSNNSNNGKASCAVLTPKGRNCAGAKNRAPPQPAASQPYILRATSVALKHARCILPVSFTTACACRACLLSYTACSTQGTHFTTAVAAAAAGALQSWQSKVCRRCCRPAAAAAAAPACARKPWHRHRVCAACYTSLCATPAGDHERWAPAPLCSCTLVPAATGSLFGAAFARLLLLL